MQHQLHTQLLQLHARYHTKPPGEPIPVTTGELAGLWFCTERNVKFILAKLVQQGWIEWQPGRGRGNVSRLRLLTEQGAFLMEAAKALVQQGRIEEALAKLEAYGSGTLARARFMDWLSGYFGYKKVVDEKRRVETLRFPITQRIRTLDPAEIWYAFDCHMVRQLYDTLVAFDAESDTLVPQLAHYWESDSAKREWRFYLRRGVLFHDGRELCADDVVYTLERLRAGGERIYHSWLGEEIEAAEARDETTVKLTLRRPNHLFGHMLSCQAASILPRGLADDAEYDIRYRPVGTGAFRLKSLGEHVCVLEAHTAYFAGRPHLDRVEIMMVAEEGMVSIDPVLPQGLKLHGTSSSAGAETVAAVEENGGKDEISCEVHMLYRGSVLLTFNLNRDGPQRDFRFRKALHHLIDRGRLSRSYPEVRRYPADRLLPLGALADADRAYEPEAARQLLHDMRYAGEPFRIAVYPNQRGDAEWLRDRGREFGIDIEVHVVDFNELLRNEDVQKADAILYQFVAEGGEVSVLEMFKLEKSFIRQHLSPVLLAEVDEAAHRLLQLPTASERESAFAELERIIVDEYAVLFLLYKEKGTLYTSSVRGVNMNSLGWTDFKDIWLQSS